MTINQKRFCTVKELKELLANCHDKVYIMVGDAQGGLFDLDMEVGVISLDPDYEGDEEMYRDMVDFLDDNYMDF